MKSRVLLASVALIAGLSGCATNGRITPVQTKAEARRQQYGEPIHLKADYLKLARYWDEHASKPTGIMGGNRARLDVFESSRTAHILSGDGMIDGMIELQGQPDGSTIMTTYAWGGAAGTVIGWRDLLVGASNR